MKTLIAAVVASAFSLGALAASHMEKGASAPMAKPAATMAAPAAASAPMAKASAPAKAKKHKKAASAV
jgi:hypothetical protein